MKAIQFLLTTLVVLIVMSSAITAQNEFGLPEAIDNLEHANLTNDISGIMNAHGLFERIISAEPENYYAVYYKLLAEYRLITADHNGEFQMLDKYYDDAIESLEKLSDYRSLASEIKTLKAAIHMMKLADSPMSGRSLSPKIHSLLDEALIDNPGNPRAYLIRGIMAFNTPAMFGGSKEDAIKFLNTSQKLFETSVEKDSVSPSWGYNETFAWLGMAYTELRDYNSAKSIYENGLEVEPNFGWIKFQLLPNLNQQVAENEN
ncbi:tetratricopeptide repeat protein [Bacteroidota bacterium]